MRYNVTHDNALPICNKINNVFKLKNFELNGIEYRWVNGNFKMEHSSATLIPPKAILSKEENQILVQMPLNKENYKRNIETPVFFFATIGDVIEIGKNEVKVPDTTTSLAELFAKK